MLVALCAIGSVTLTVIGPTDPRPRHRPDHHGTYGGDGIDFGSLHRTLAMAVGLYVVGGAAAGLQLRG